MTSNTESEGVKCNCWIKLHSVLCNEFSQAWGEMMKDSVLVKANYIYYIKENVLDIIITLETNL
jgi:hypothetical protein